MNIVVHLIRHAPHDQLGRTLTGRAPEAHLSAQGRAQAAALAERLAATRFGAICSSPQPRTRETAETVAKAQGATVQVFPDFDEIDFGRWAGQSFDALESDPDWKCWNRERDEAATPGGETMQGVAARMVGRIEALRREANGRDIAIVSHSDPIKSVVCHYLGLPFGRMHQFDISPASVTRIVVGDWGGKVLALNDTAALDSPGGQA